MGRGIHIKVQSWACLQAIELSLAEETNKGHDIHRATGPLLPEPSLTYSAIETLAECVKKARRTRRTAKE